MTKVRFYRWFVCVVVGGSTLGAERSLAAAPPSVPSFAEVYSLVQSNLAGMGAVDFNRAAVLGLISQLSSRVMLVTNNAVVEELSALPLVSKATVLESAYGFIRIARVGAGLAQELSKSWDQLRSTNRLNGLVIDLRFAVGQDYAAAADAADLFFKSEQPLLRWGEATVRSKSKSSSIDLPLVVLINHETTGAAEALAAALHQAGEILLIGSATAGRAYLFRDLPLSTGQTLRVATGWITAGDEQKLSDEGLMPDIRVAVSFEDEKAYFEDPYKVIPRAFAQTTRVLTNEQSAALSPNRSRRRLNEAELVRMQRDGTDFEPEVPGVMAQTTSPVVTDPALSRGLDLLKGLALASKRH